MEPIDIQWVPFLFSKSQKYLENFATSRKNFATPRLKKVLVFFNKALTFFLALFLGEKLLNETHLKMPLFAKKICTFAP